jgi:chromosome segregation ATPase
MSNFLNDFENSLKRLANVNTLVNKNIENKKLFSGMILTRLTQINARINYLAENINKLKSKVIDLQNYVYQNENDCKIKSEEQQKLQEDLKAMQDEKTDLLNKFNALQTKCTNDMATKQSKIDELEETLRTAMQTNDRLRQEKEILDSELKALQAKGEDNHTTEITKQADEFKQQIAELIQENKAKVNELTKTIEDKDTQINEINEKLASAAKETAEHKYNLDQQRNKTEQSIQQLQSEISNLKKENQNLIDRIMQATLAINKAVDNLDELSNNASDKENGDNIENAFKRIEESINNISNAINLNTVNNTNLSLTENDTNLKGGKISRPRSKTRKIKKQKGGFVYNKVHKRNSIKFFKTY